MLYLQYAGRAGDLAWEYFNKCFRNGRGIRFSCWIDRKRLLHMDIWIGVNSAIKCWYYIGNIRILRQLHRWRRYLRKIWLGWCQIGLGGLYRTGRNVGRSLIGGCRCNIIWKHKWIDAGVTIWRIQNGRIIVFGRM